MVTFSNNRQAEYNEKTHFRSQVIDGAQEKRRKFGAEQSVGV